MVCATDPINQPRRLTSQPHHLACAVRLVCKGCGEELLVAFSCKKRGFCPSCVGRRMSDVAAHLVDEVFPEEVPMRQWVCSLPWALRYVLGYDRKLCADVLRAFISTLKQCLRRRAKREFGLRSVSEAQVGAVTVVQRSDSALRLNVHFHTLAADGVWVRDADGELRFRELPPPSAEDVAEVASRSYEKLVRVLRFVVSGHLRWVGVDEDARLDGDHRSKSLSFACRMALGTSAALAPGANPTSPENAVSSSSKPTSGASLSSTSRRPRSSSSPRVIPRAFRKRRARSRSGSGRSTVVRMHKTYSDGASYAVQPVSVPRTAVTRASRASIR